MLKTDLLKCLVPGRIGKKAGLSWHTGMPEPLFSPRGLSIRLCGSDLIHGSLGLPRAHKQKLPGAFKD